jgi:hypothetical protein
VQVKTSTLKRAVRPTFKSASAMQVTLMMSLRRRRRRTQDWTASCRLHTVLPWHPREKAE